MVPIPPLESLNRQTRSLFRFATTCELGFASTFCRGFLLSRDPRDLQSEAADRAVYWFTFRAAESTRRSQQEARSKNLSFRRGHSPGEERRAHAPLAVSSRSWHGERRFRCCNRCCLFRSGRAMLPNITIPLDALPQEREGPEDVLVAFSVHGLGSFSRTTVAASSTRWGGSMSSEASPPQQQQKEAPKKGWLSSFNTAVVGDRPDTITM